MEVGLNLILKKSGWIGGLGIARNGNVSFDIICDLLMQETR